jgi:poly-gamma-glutamate synthesis protein (capsule biosynthesis protein)
MMVRRKRKLKRFVYYLLFLLFILLILLIILIFKSNNTSSLDNEKNNEEIINNIVEQINEEGVDSQFLLWLTSTYQISLEKFEEYLNNNDYDYEMWHKLTKNSYKVLKYLYQDETTTSDNIKYIEGEKETISLSFVGDVSLADNWYIMPKYDGIGKKVYGILSEDVVDIMKNSDIMVANNEFTISNRGEQMAGKTYTFKASPERLSIYEEMGVDLVTLANNHVYDFGKDAFYDMLDSLEEYNLPYIGAGRNLEEAMKPYYFIINGYKIAFVNATRAEKNILTPEATEDEGGVLRCYDPTIFSEVIKEAKQESDYVIALVHWGREDSHQLEDVQVSTSRTYIDAGADVIIGTHAHVLQGIEFYNDKPIIYNLGDFIFNNETKDTGIFQITLSEDGTLEYYFIPCLEQDEYTKTLEGEEKQRVIEEMISWSKNVSIDSSGKITQAN